MTFIFEFDSGNVRVVADNERDATVHAAVTAKVMAGEFILNIQRNPRGRHASPYLPCGCNKIIQRVVGNLTVDVDRSSEAVCSGCGAGNS